MRVTAIVRKGIPHTISHLEAEVPNVVVTLRLENKLYKITGCYREWNYSGRESSRTEQMDRWTIFEDIWMTNNKRCRHSILLGDMNFCMKGNVGNGSPHQASLELLRSSVIDNIILKGWSQLIQLSLIHI